MTASTETLTIVLKGDGSGLTGTLRTSTGEVQRFGAVLDASSGKVSGTGAASRAASRDIDALTTSTRQNHSTMREWATGLNTVRGTLATLGISLVARELLGAGLAMDRLERSTAAAMGSQALAGRELAFVREQAQRLGIYFPLLAEGYAGLAAATRGTNLQGEKTREIFLGVAEAARAMNLSTERTQGVLNAVQQIAGKGTVSMEELRQQLGDRLPGAMQIAARAMDMTVAELVKLVSEGKIASEDFLPKFAAELRKSAAAGVELARNSPAATFERLKTVLFDLGVAVARDGGVLGSLALGASALTSALNLLVSSGALPYITKGLLAIAAVSAVFYVGGLLQRGFVALATSIALTRAPMAVFNVGMVAGAAGAQGLTLRMAAASVGARGLAAALAFIQANPIGLVITAAALLVTWLVNSQAAAKAAAEEIRTGFQSARQALDDFNKSPSLAATFTLADAKIGETVDKIRERVAELRKEQEKLNLAVEQQKRYGFVEPGLKDEIRRVTDETTSLTRQINELQMGATQAAGTITDLVQRTAGLSTVAPEARRELMGVATEVANGNLLLEDALPKWQSIIERFYGAEVAARVSADGIREIISAASGATEIIADLDKNVAQLNVRLAGLKGGSEAAIRLRTGYAIMEKGGPDKMTQAELAEIGLRMREEIRLSGAVEAAQEAQKESRKANTAATRDQAKAQREKIRDDNAELRAVDALNALVRDQVSLYGGPVQQELKAYQDALARVDKIQRDLTTAHRLDAEALGLLKQARSEIEAAHVRGADIAKREQDEIDRSLDLASEAARLYDEETRAMIGTSREREVQKALIEAETQAREQYAKGLRTTIDLQAEEASRIRESVERGFDARKVALEQQQYAEDVRGAWVNAANDGARAFGDWFARGFKGAKDFASSVKDIFKRLLSDLVSMMLQNTLVRPFQNWMQQIMGSATSGGGLGATGQSGGLLSGFGNIMSSGFDKLLSGIGSLFGMGGQASTGIASAVSAAVPDAVNAGMSVAGGGAGAGAATGAAGAFAKIIPIIGWIYAGMQLNGGLYDGGWKIGAHGNFMDAMKGSAATGSIGLTATAFASGTLDDLLQRLGVSGKWASMLSGSSVFAKLFGRSDPKITGQGITGSYGYDGFSGQSYADIMQKGGWFRSDKKWTEYGALDSQVDAAFDAAAQAVNKAATSLAEQAGMDISQQLASVRISIGKLQLSSDAEEAKKQLEAVLNQMIETLSARAVEAMGFASLLDDGYAATEIMTALSAAIQLVTGNVGKLERSLTALEVQKVAQAVEYFERMAETAGTTLAAAIEEITGLLANYSNLIGGVRQQIATHGLNEYQKAQLDVELQYRDMVAQANALAKALGLAGARSEDLATLEQWRAIQMADLAQQYAAQQAAQQQTWLQDLSLSDLSPLRDDQKLSSIMDMLNAAVASNDMGRAQELAEQALRLGRDLYASGEDYNALYAQVTGLVGDIAPQTMEDLQGLTNEELANLADLVAGLPSQIAQELFDLLIAPPPTTDVPTDTLPPPPTTNPAPPSSGGGGGGGSGGYDTPQCVAFDMFMDDGSRAIDAQAGFTYDTLDPATGYARMPARVVGAPVLQPCVRIVTQNGAALVCSRSTPFTDPDAPADLPEYSTLAPDMLGKRVFVQHRGRVRVERVTRVLDAGDREVVPIDFGGRSFPAGEDPARLIYSHNMMKTDPYAGIMSDEMARSFGQLNDSVLQVVEAVQEQNARIAAMELEAMSNGSRSGGLGGKTGNMY